MNIPFLTNKSNKKPDMNRAQRREAAKQKGMMEKQVNKDKKRRMGKATKKGLLNTN